MLAPATAPRGSGNWRRSRLSGNEEPAYEHRFAALRCTRLCGRSHIGHGYAGARERDSLLPIDAGRRPLDDHREVAGEEALERIRTSAAPLAGASVLCLTSADAAGSQAPQLPPLAPAADGRRGRRGPLARARGRRRTGRSASGSSRRSAAPSSPRRETEWDEWVEESASALEPELEQADVVVVARRRCARLRRGRPLGRAPLCVEPPRGRVAHADPVAAERLRDLLGERRGRGRRAGHRPAQPAQPRAAAQALGPGAALAGRRPHAALRLPDGHDRPLDRPAHGDRRVRPAQGVAARAPARHRRRAAGRGRRATCGSRRRSTTTPRAARTCT